MPGSFPVFDAVVAHLIARCQPATALDIGTGSGKYGHMLATHAPQCERTGLDLEPSYVDRFGLPQLYHHMHLADGAQWCHAHPQRQFDMVFLGDSLEHMGKSAGIDLLNAMVYRCAWLVIVAPEFVVQGAVDGVASEAHRSVWSERDLHWHDLWAWDNCRATTLMVLRGYLPCAALGMGQWVDEINGAQVPLRHFDGQETVRPARLRLVQHPREVEYRQP
ncbi:class I SAM-dependent methyltransferase [Ideonella sp. DXS22W]|uniref:Class I SAM-dependent methyltransferase n=1 Tax=Pseudaquabacterium inlustre TaxID=2984192 RepID=A0ABU9CGG3_9BURK